MEVGNPLKDEDYLRVQSVPPFRDFTVKAPQSDVGREVDEDGVEGRNALGRTSRTERG